MYRIISHSTFLWVPNSYIENFHLRESIKVGPLNFNYECLSLRMQVFLDVEAYWFLL